MGPLRRIKPALSRLAERIQELRVWGFGSIAGLDRIALGKRGERIAERHLRRCGYRIIERNYRAVGAEIDLIAMDGATLVFVEVKARHSTRAGMPSEAVNHHKTRHIRRAAQAYALRHRQSDRPMRFDIVAICDRGDGARELELLRDAF